jgi:hypothetical protein
MKSIKFILNFKLKYVLAASILPVENKTFSRFISSAAKIIYLCFDRTGRIRDRLVIANNFIQFLMKLNKHHGSSFTVKWLKACTVALQKWLGNNSVKTLRELEPGLPLPRVINGCPAIINRQDRLLMAQGNVHVIRFWHSLFSLYRVLSIPGKLKLETISAPFTGDEKVLESICTTAKTWPWSKKIKDVLDRSNLAPTTFHFSGKASPSNVNSSQGLLVDIYLLMSDPAGGEVWSNLLSYLDVVQQKWQTLQFLTRLQDGQKIIEGLPDDAFDGIIKKSMSTPFGQFAIKREAAGKIRVFALVDSISQSVMKPLHLALFNVLKQLPNDGTFDQDASVARSAVKAQAANKAYSFDLSAATDRLPVSLTGAILDGLFRDTPGIGQAWAKFMVERDFSFNSVTKKEFSLPDDHKLRYAVGQPMGCLSSWAGLAITHHWIMQYCSYLVTNNWVWEDRYEVLGDDIVIFDSKLADTYLGVMKTIGMEINLSKSIVSHDKPVFEFAKRTVWGDNLVSGISYSQINSCTSLSSRINNVYTWIKKGYLNNLQTITTVLNNFNPAVNFKDFSLMASSFSILGLCKNIGHKFIMKSLVDPNKGCLWDMDAENFSVPTRSLLTKARDLITKGESDLELSKDENRQEWFDESEQLVVAGVLQDALYKSRLLSEQYSGLIKEWSKSLVSKSFNDEVLLATITGWLEDAIIDNRNSKIIDPFEIEDKVENILRYHAKTQMVTLERAYEILQEVEGLWYAFSKPTKTTQNSFNRLGSQFLKDMSKPFFMKGPQYWAVLGQYKSITDVGKPAFKEVLKDFKYDPVAANPDNWKFSKTFR